MAVDKGIFASWVRKRRSAGRSPADDMVDDGVEEARNDGDGKSSSALARSHMLSCGITSAMGGDHMVRASGISRLRGPDDKLSTPSFFFEYSILSLTSWLVVIPDYSVLTVSVQYLALTLPRNCSRLQLTFSSKVHRVRSIARCP